MRELEHTRAAYRTLRALWEDLLAADEEQRTQIEAAAAWTLRYRCSACGSPIDHELRQRQEEVCIDCLTPPMAGRTTARTSDDIPS